MKDIKELYEKFEEIGQLITCLVYLSSYWERINNDFMHMTVLAQIVEDKFEQAFKDFDKICQSCE